MTHDELVEKVARKMADETGVAVGRPPLDDALWFGTQGAGIRTYWLNVATAAVSVVLEEAAKVARKAAEPKECDRRSYDYSTGVWECSLERKGSCLCIEREEEAEEIAAAILALGRKG